MRKNVHEVARRLIRNSSETSGSQITAYFFRKEALNSSNTSVTGLWDYASPGVKQQPLTIFERLNLSFSLSLFLSFDTCYVLCLNVFKLYIIVKASENFTCKRSGFERIKQSFASKPLLLFYTPSPIPM